MRPQRPFRWGVFQADLNPTKGSEQQGVCPVLVISDEDFNEAMPIVTVLPLTSREANRKLYPGEVLVRAGTAGLEVDSIVLAYQVRTISKRRLGELYGYLEEPSLRQKVKGTLMEHLGIL